MKHIISLLAFSSMLVFLSCSTDYEGNVGGASDPNYCNAPDSVSDTDAGAMSVLPLSDAQKAEYKEGCEIYVVKCANCHMLDGVTINASVDLADHGNVNESLCPTCEEHSVLLAKINATMPPERGKSKPLSTTDSAKVATYIRANFYSDITPLNDETNNPLNTGSVGGTQYNTYCSGCHGLDGQGDTNFPNPMTEYTVDRQTLIGKIDGTGLGLSGYSQGTDLSMTVFAGNPADLDADAIADYMNATFNYGW